MFINYIPSSFPPRSGGVNMCQLETHHGKKRDVPKVRMVVVVVVVVVVVEYILSINNYCWRASTAGRANRVGVRHIFHKSDRSVEQNGGWPESVVRL